MRRKERGRIKVTIKTQTTTCIGSLSLHRMRGEGRGEGLRASALVAAPLNRPAATFSPRSAKGEGNFGAVAWQFWAHTAAGV